MPGDARALSDPPNEQFHFVFLSGRLSLAFCATVGERWDRGFERLRTPDDLTRWYLEAGVLDAHIGTTQAGLRAARLLREAIYEIAKALIDRHAPPVRDEELVNAAAAAPPLIPRMHHGTASLVTPGPGAEAEAAALSVVARDAIDLFVSPLSGSRIRECASSRCGLLFVDLSRPGRRRWCSSAACGGRERTAAHRRRTRARAS